MCRPSTGLAHEDRSLLRWTVWRVHSMRSRAVCSVFHFHVYVRASCVVCVRVRRCCAVPSRAVSRVASGGTVAGEMLAMSHAQLLHARRAIPCGPPPPPPPLSKTPVLFLVVAVDVGALAWLVAMLCRAASCCGVLLRVRQCPARLFGTAFSGGRCCSPLSPCPPQCGSIPVTVAGCSCSCVLVCLPTNCDQGFSYSFWVVGAR